MQTIYRDNQDWVSLPSDEEEEEDEGEEWGANDDEAKVFLEDLESDKESKNSIDSKNRWKSFALENNDEAIKILSANQDLNKNMEAYASESNIIKNSNDKFSENFNETTNNHHPSSEIKSEGSDDSKADRHEKIKLSKHRTEHINPHIHKVRYIEANEKMLHQIHTSSANSVTHDYTSRKQAIKTKDIYGINRVGLFMRDWTFKEWIEKIMSVPENKLIELDPELRVIAILSISDIIAFFRK